MADNVVSLFLTFFVVVLLQDRNKKFVWEGAGLTVPPLKIITSHCSVSSAEEAKGSLGDDLRPPAAI